MNHYNLSNCLFFIDTLRYPNSKWHLFESSHPNQSPCQMIRIQEISPHVFSLSTKDQTTYLTASEHNLAHVLDEKIYRLCMESLIENKVFHLHSSFVLYKGKAILFTGPSGIGKTTQAELWRDYEKAVIVNGDVTLIRKCQGKYHAFGAPIHGSSPYCENRNAPVIAVIVLEQSIENHLVRLDSFQSLTSCLPEIFRPNMPENVSEILWETLDDFFQEIPIYRLRCRPDQEAVKLVKDQVLSSEYTEKRNLEININTEIIT